MYKNTLTNEESYFGVEIVLMILIDSNHISFSKLYLNCIGVYISEK